MKTLPIETCKRLKEAGVEIETELFYSNESIYTDRTKFFLGLSKKKYKKYIYYPAPNLEEAIEILPKEMYELDKTFFLNFGPIISKSLTGNTKVLTIWYIQYQSGLSHAILGNAQKGATLLDAVNEMINYLIDNKLIGKN